jgi:hypothetical protein
MIILRTTTTPIERRSYKDWRNKVSNIETPILQYFHFTKWQIGAGV